MTAAAEFVALAQDIAAEASALAFQRRHEGVSVAASKSSPEDIVTAADREVEQLIKGRLADARPNDGFLGEETGEASSASGITWVVDPIDGTVNYLYGIPAYAVSIAVVEGDADPATWESIAGVVANPAADETFVATRGGGATLNGRALSVNRNVPLNLALTGTGFSYAAERRVVQAGVVQNLLAEVRDIRRIGSAALDLCNVAAGRIDAYYERGLNPWDLGAGALIAEEAGATVAGFDGARYGRDLTIAAAPELFVELEIALKRAGLTLD